MRTIWRVTGACAVLVPAAVSAQATKQTHVLVSARQPANGACASLIAGPSELVRTPEGKAILRLKRELEGMSTVIEQRRTPPEAQDARKMDEIRRGVDSMLKVIVRYANPDGSMGPPITFTRTDTTSITVNGKVLDRRGVYDAMDGALRGVRPVMERALIEMNPRSADHFEITLRAMEPQVAEMARTMASSSAPVGYLGLSLSGSQIRIVTDSGSFTSHCDYPMIEAVDVPSPARTAGLSAGDTLVAYNGRDVMVQAVNYPRLLTPGNVVRITVRRDGRKRDVPVTVSERPPEMADKNVLFSSRSTTSRPATGGVMAAGSSMTALQGATLSAVDDDFAQTLGVEPGLLILRVQPGSVAADAGLRGGEMIRAVNGTPVRDLVLLQRVMRLPDTHTVKLTVSGRDTPPRIVTLRF